MAGEHGANSDSAVVRRHRAQIVDFGTAEDLHPSVVQLLGPTAECEPRFLNARRGDGAVIANVAGDHDQAELGGLRN